MRVTSLWVSKEIREKAKATKKYAAEAAKRKAVVARPGNAVENMPGNAVEAPRKVVRATPQSINTAMRKLKNARDGTVPKPPRVPKTPKVPKTSKVAKSSNVSKRLKAVEAIQCPIFPLLLPSPRLDIGKMLDELSARGEINLKKWKNYLSVPILDEKIYRTIVRVLAKVPGNEGIVSSDASAPSSSERVLSLSLLSKP